MTDTTTPQSNVPEGVASMQPEGLPENSPEISIEEADLRDAAAKADEGKFEHTILEHWSVKLTEELNGYTGEATIDTYDVFLKSWPWLGYGDVEKVRKELATLIGNALDVLDEAIERVIAPTKGRTKETVFASYENDWEENKDIYLEVMAQWIPIGLIWADKWRYMSVKEKATYHVAVAIASNTLNGPNGMLDFLRNVYGFGIGDEEGQQLTVRISEIRMGAGDE